MLHQLPAWRTLAYIVAGIMRLQSAGEELGQEKPQMAVDMQNPGFGMEVDGSRRLDVDNDYDNDDDDDDVDVVVDVVNFLYPTME